MSACSLAHKIEAYKLLNKTVKALEYPNASVHDHCGKDVSEAPSNLREALYRRLPELKKELVEEIKTDMALRELEDRLKCDGMTEGN